MSLLEEGGRRRGSGNFADESGGLREAVVGGVGGVGGEGGWMCLHHDVAAAVQGEVVGAGEGAVALGASERLDARVLAEVPRQLVGAGEAPGAALPGAVVRLLSCRGQQTEEKQREEGG